MATTTTTNDTSVLSPMSAAARLRRFQRVLGDLGLSGALGRNWVTFHEGRFQFADLTDRHSDDLLRRLEDVIGLGEGVRTPSPAAVASIVGPLTEVAAPVLIVPASHSTHIDLPF